MPKLSCYTGYKLRELIRISTAFSHTRHLKVFSNICRFALERKGEILVKVDSSKIADLIAKTFDKHYEESMIEDYMLTAEALNLVTHVSKTAYGLTDYGFCIATVLNDDDIKSDLLTNFERYIYLQLVIRKDYDYLLALLRSLSKSREDSQIIGSIFRKSRCPSLEKLRDSFQTEIAEIISGLNLGLEGKEVALKMEKMKKRTLNHRLSSLIFWLTEIISTSSLFKPRPDLLGYYDTVYAKTFSELKKSLEELDLDHTIDSIVDEKFPELFSQIFGINAHSPKRECGDTIASQIINMLNSEWDKFAKLQPYQFGQRIPALAFLVFAQFRLLHQNMLTLPLSNLLNIFSDKIESFGYVLNWRYDFHSGYIEKIT